jgi:hypothetical protein
VIELTQKQIDFLTLLDRLPDEYTIQPAQRTPAALASPKSKRGRPPIVYNNSALITYMDNRLNVVPVDEPILPDWLENIISGALTWRDSKDDNTHKLSPFRMRAIMTMLPVISTDAVMALPSDSRRGKRRGKSIGKRTAQYYVKAAVVACSLAAMHMKSDRWKPDMYDLEAEELGYELFDLAA